MTNAASVKNRLKNKAVATGKTMQEMLTVYGLERFIYRLSVSEYADRFVLKGGVFLYALFDGEFARTTRDVDLLANNMPNSAEKIKDVFVKIFSVPCDDALEFDLTSLTVRDISEFKEYHGVNVFIMARLDRTRVPVSIDVGFGDVVYPRKVKMEFPVLLDMPVPKVYAYSLYSVISEKFEAIVSLGDANSRYKDFYDIFLLADRRRLDGDELTEALRKTFERRGTRFDDIVVFDKEFGKSAIHQRRWKAFLEKKKTMKKIEFKAALDLIKTLLSPVVISIQAETQFDLVWDHEAGEWK